MKKKVTIISEACGGGVRKHILDLLFNLSYDKYELYFLYSLNRADETMKSELESLKKNNINLIELKELYRDIDIKNDLKAFIEMKAVLTTIAPDIVHCHSSKSGAIGRVVAKMIGIKQIYYTPHAYIMQNPNIGLMKKVTYSLIESTLSRFFTTKNINVSYGEEKFAIQNNIDKKHKFSVIYNGIDEYRFNHDVALLKRELGINEDDIVIGVTARMDEQKDPFTFIKIAHKVVNKHKNIKFIYVGDGVYKDKATQYVNENKLVDSIKLLGFRSDIDRLLQIFDVYMITSLYEGMPYSLIEALKYKLPIIATNTIGNNEVVSDNFNGYLFEVQNYDQGSEKVSQLINNKNLMIEMSNNSYKLFKDKFTLTTMISKIEKLYDV